MTHYQILEIPKSAAPTEIKRAYRRLALRYHPDVNPDPAAHSKFLAVKTAMEVLSDPHRRARYDRFGDRPVRMASRPQPARSAPEPAPRAAYAHAYIHSPPRPEPAQARPKPAKDAPFLMKAEYFFFTAPLYYYMLVAAGLSFLISMYNLIAGVVPLSFVYERRVSPIAMEGFSFIARMVVVTVAFTLIAVALRYVLNWVCNEVYRKKRESNTAFA